MDTPFIFNKYVTGTNFVARTNELNTLVGRIKKKEHCLIYEPPKSGKRSIVHQVFTKLRQDSYNFTPCFINLFNVRSEDELLRNIRTSLVHSFAKTDPEIRALEEDLMLDQIREMKEYRDLILNLSEALSSKFNTNIVVYFQEFQELLNFEQPEDTIALLDRVWRTHTHTTYLITGSFVNAMKELFENRKWFYRFAERIRLEKIEERFFYRVHYQELPKIRQSRLTRTCIPHVQPHRWPPMLHTATCRHCVRQHTRFFNRNHTPRIFRRANRTPLIPIPANHKQAHTLSAQLP